MKGESILAHILSEAECKAQNNCECCPLPICPGGGCLTCPIHCPCCNGPLEGICNQCTEEDCGNRTAPYDPSSFSKKED